MHLDIWNSSHELFFDLLLIMIKTFTNALQKDYCLIILKN